VRGMRVQTVVLIQAGFSLGAGQRHEDCVIGVGQGAAHASMNDAAIGAFLILPLDLALTMQTVAVLMILSLSVWRRRKR